MATTNQLKANKENAKLAGVKSITGKNKVRFNSMKHGLSSNKLVFIKGYSFGDYEETEQDFKDLLEGYLASVLPANALEESFVIQIAKAMFKLSRCDYLESYAISETYSSDIDLEQIQRYRVSLENQALKFLRAIINIRSDLDLDLFCNPGGQEND